MVGREMIIIRYSLYGKISSISFDVVARLEMFDSNSERWLIARKIVEQTTVALNLKYR